MSFSSLRLRIQKSAVVTSLCLVAALVVTLMVSTSVPSVADTSDKSTGKTVVVTGFGPFGEREHNTSWDVAQKVADALKADGETQVVLQEIPTRWSTFEDQLRKLVSDYQPDALISIGEKSENGFTIPQVELQARNNRSGDDIDGVAGSGQDVIAGGSWYLKAAAENQSAQQETVKSGFNLNTSTDAGDFLCNAALYVGIDMQNHGLVNHAAFFHVPALAQGASQTDQFAAAIADFTQNLADLPASTPAASQSATPTPTATETATVVPSSTPTATATSSSTPAPTGTATAVPTSKATPTGEQPKNEEPTSTGDEDLSDVVISQRVDKVGSETTGTSQQTHPTGLNELTQSEGDVNVKTDAETSEIKGVKGTQAQTTTQKNTAANAATHTAGGEQRVNAPKGGLLTLATTGSTAMWIIIAAGVLALSGALTVGVSALRTRKKNNNTPDADSE